MIIAARLHWHRIHPFHFGVDIHHDPEMYSDLDGELRRTITIAVLLGCRSATILIEIGKDN